MLFVCRHLVGKYWSNKIIHSIKKSHNIIKFSSEHRKHLHYFMVICQTLVEIFLSGSEPLTVRRRYHPYSRAASMAENTSCCSKGISKTFPHISSEQCLDWPPVEFILQTNGGQQTTNVTAYCFSL